MKILTALKRALNEFCTETSLHGLKYVVEPRRALIERFFWRLVMFLAFIATTLILQLVSWVGFSRMPVKTTLASVNFPSLIIEQPAITICDTNKANKHSTDLIMETMTFDNDMEKEKLKESLPNFMRYMYSGMKQAYTGSSIHDVDKLMEWTEFIRRNDLTVNEFLLRLQPNCTDVILKCSQRGKPINCSNLFRSSRSGFGFCCSLNYEQYSDALFMFDSPKDVLPMQSSFEDALRILLNITSQDSLYSEFYKDVICILLHSPKDYPNVNTAKAVLSSGTETFMKYKTDALISAPALKDLPSSVRQCYMSDEIKLKYFDHYTLNNCAVESDMELLIKKCNCLMPIHPNIGIFKECTIFDHFCINIIANELLTGRPDKKFVIIDGKTIPCLARCTYVHYAPSVSYGELVGAEMDVYELWDGIENHTGLTTLRLYQLSSESKFYKKTVAIEPVTEMMIICSVAGVVFGLNVFSVFEVIFFFTFRFYHYMKQQF